MILDSSRAEAIYLQYCRSGDTKHLSLLIEMVMPLADVIALSISQDRFDDLKQEALLKAFTLLQTQQYRPGRGASLYSYLSTVMRNSMIDRLRRDREYDELPEGGVIGASLYDSSDCFDTETIRQFAIGRFPSLHYSISSDAAQYVADGIIEAANLASKGIPSTLETWYPLNRREAYIFYRSILAYIRLVAAGHCPELAPIFKSMLPQLEWTLLPEVNMLVGLDAFKILYEAMRGSYVKF